MTVSREPRLVNPRLSLTARRAQTAGRRRARRARAAVSAAALALAAAVSGCAAVNDSDAAVALADERYEVGDFKAYLATLSDENPAVASRAAAARWLTGWAVTRAFELQLASRGFPVTNDHMSDAVAEMTRSDSSFVPGAPGNDLIIRSRAVLLALEDAVQERLADTAARFLCSRHILVPTDEDAQAVLTRLDAGEPFADLALEVSLDAGSGSLGGDLGCVLEGSFVSEFEQAAYAAGPGKVVTARSQFGVHVIEVISAGPPTASHHPQLDPEALQALAEAPQEAFGARLEQAFSDYFDEVMQEAVKRYASDVEVHERYGRWDPDEFKVVVEAS